MWLSGAGLPLRLISQKLATPIDYMFKIYCSCNKLADLIFFSDNTSGCTVLQLLDGKKKTVRTENDVFKCFDAETKALLISKDRLDMIGRGHMRFIN